MHVNIRTFYRIILTGLALSAVGLLLDVDHWYAVVRGWPNGQWLHHTLASTPSLLILLSLLWGLVITSLTLGWDNLETRALLLIKKDIEMGLPMFKQSSSNPENNTLLDILLDQQTQDVILTEE